MGIFALPKWEIWFASIFGILLFSMNFIIIFMEADFDSWRPIALICIISIIYLSFIISTVMEPLKDLKKMTKAEMEDHEYERIIIEDEFSNSYDSITNNSA